MVEIELNLIAIRYFSEISLFLYLPNSLFISRMALQRHYCVEQNKRQTIPTFTEVVLLNSSAHNNKKKIPFSYGLTRI